MNDRERRVLRRTLAGLLLSASLGFAGCDGSPTESVGGPAPDEGGAARTTASPWSMTSIPALAGDAGLDVDDVNDAGWVVGRSYSSGTRALLWTSSHGSIHLGGGLGSVANAVSNGTPALVAGSVQDAAYVAHPARWTISQDGSAAVTQVVLDDVGSAKGINDQGDLVGFSGTDAVVWPVAGGPTVVAPPAGSDFTSGIAQDINNAGHVVLVFSTDSLDRGFLRLPSGSLVEFSPEPGDVHTYARHVTDVHTDGSVLVAGTTRKSESEFRAVRWKVDATSGAILATRVMTGNGSAGSMSEAGDLGGSIQKQQFNPKPTIWTDATTYTMPIPKGKISGSVRAISPNGRFAVGWASGMSGRTSLRWAR